MARAFIGAVFFMLILSLGVVAVQDSMDRGGEPYTVQGESIADSPLTGGQTYEVDNANVPNARFQNRVEVRNGTGEMMVADEDYVWYPSNGSVKVVTGGRIDGDEEMTITYAYNVPTDEQRELTTIVGQLISSGEAFMWAFGAIISIAFLRLLAGVAS